MITGCAVATAIAAALAPAPTAALEEFPACVTIVASGKSFPLIPLIDTGKNLNRVSRSSRYDPEATYVIVLWSNGAESIIRIEDERPSVEGSKGVDFEGNSWIISSDVENCG